MRRSNFALRLQPSLLDEARKLAEAEGVALNQLINVAVAEKENGQEPLAPAQPSERIESRGTRQDTYPSLDRFHLAGHQRGSHFNGHGCVGIPPHC